jgi:hypothetical protein
LLDLLEPHDNLVGKLLSPLLAATCNSHNVNVPESTKRFDVNATDETCPEYGYLDFLYLFAHALPLSNLAFIGMI